MLVFLLQISIEDSYHEDMIVFNDVEVGGIFDKIPSTLIIYHVI